MATTFPPDNPHRRPAKRIPGGWAASKGPAKVGRASLGRTPYDKALLGGKINSRTGPGGYYSGPARRAGGRAMRGAENAMIAHPDAMTMAIIAAPVGVYLGANAAYYGGRAAYRGTKKAVPKMAAGGRRGGRMVSAKAGGTIRYAKGGL